MSRLLPKYKREEAKRAKREAKLDKSRKENTRRINVLFLIVCEGKKTEPNYFEAKIKSKPSDVIDADVEGKGRGTVSLIKKTIEIRDSGEKDYDRVWAVFDKDNFTDFNKAIKLAEKNNIFCAWSNESFELWYYLHFQYLDTAITRQQYIGKLEREIRNRSNDKKYKYEKNDPNTYNILQQYGKEENAISFARKLQENYKGDSDYATHKPCTMVYKLVEELNNPEKVLEEISPC